MGRCHLFVSLLSEKFLKSKWTLREVGFIASRSKVKIAPLSIDQTVASGFISHLQSRPIRADGITCNHLVEPLAKRFPREIFPCLIRRAGSTHRLRAAEFKMRSLLPSLERLTTTEAQDLADAAIRNPQAWSSDRCRNDCRPDFIRVHGGNLKAETLQALKYRIKEDDWYRGSP